MVISRFGPKLHVYGVQLTKRLVDHFSSLVRSEPDDEAALAAHSSLKALLSTLESLEGHPELFPHIEAAVLPLIGHLITGTRRGGV